MEVTGPVGNLLIILSYTQFITKLLSLSLSTASLVHFKDTSSLGCEYLPPRAQLDPAALPVAEADPGPADCAPLPLRLVPLGGLAQLISIGHNNLETWVRRGFGEIKMLYLLSFLNILQCHHARNEPKLRMIKNYELRVWLKTVICFVS